MYVLMSLYQDYEGDLSPEKKKKKQKRFKPQPFARSKALAICCISFSLVSFSFDEILFMVCNIYVLQPLFSALGVLHF